MCMSLACSRAAASPEAEHGVTTPGQRGTARVVIRLRVDNFNWRAAGVPFRSVLAAALAAVNRIFHQIDVQIAWQDRAQQPAQAGRAEYIELQLEAAPPSREHSGSLAYSKPFATSGIRIHVFADRIMRVAGPDLAAPLLGHVMAHEIAHVLERSNGHSATGLMKANWEAGDYREMRSRFLGFEASDAEWIQTSLSTRPLETTADPVIAKSEKPARGSEPVEDLRFAAVRRRR